MVSGYCYTKSGSKGPILCPRKDNENPTTTDETFNAFFLFPLVLTFIYFKDRDATSYKLSTLSPFFGSLIYHDTRKEGNWQETRQAAAEQWKLHTLWLYSLRCKCKCSTTFLINAFFPALVWESCKVITELLHFTIFAKSYFEKQALK